MTDLEELDWEADGLLLTAADSVFGLVYDEGFDDVGEIDGDDPEAAGDGVEMSRLRYTSRALTVGLSLSAGTDDDAFAAALDDIRQAIDLLPNRSTGLRTIRWRRLGEVTKQLRYRPARGKPLEVKSDEARLKYNNSDVVMHMEAPMPIIQSDALHTIEMTAGVPVNVPNAGSHCVGGTGLWELQADAAVRLSHNDYEGEWVVFPSSGAVSVTRPDGCMTPEISGVGTYGICHGPDNAPFPRWPLLRPGDNSLTASVDATLTYRDTW